MSSANKKTPRKFQCRNGLWSTFEDMASELECSVDYLINDAMKQYARQRGYTHEHSQVGAPADAPSSPTAGAAPPPAPRPPEPATESVVTPLPGPLPLAVTAPAPAPAAPAAPVIVRAPRPVPGPTVNALPNNLSLGGPPPIPPGPSPSGPPPIPGVAASGAGQAPGPPPVPSAAPRPPGRAPQMTVPLSPSRIPPMPSGTGAIPAPPPPRPAAPRPVAAAAITQSLTIHYQGQPFQVTKDRFIIGRGKTSSDLTIRDPNVSRQHALVEFSGGNFYMVDMGSTNGVEFNGQRVNRKAIQNGDVFRVCDHELFCSMN